MAIVKATNHVECPPKERHLGSEYSSSDQIDIRVFLLLLLLPLLFLMRLWRGWDVKWSWIGGSCLIAEIAFATSAVRPRADVAYCIQALSRRLTKTHNWTVRIGSLICICSDRMLSSSMWFGVDLCVVWIGKTTVLYGYLAWLVMYITTHCAAQHVVYSTVMNLRWHWC